MARFAPELQSPLSLRFVTLAFAAAVALSVISAKETAPRCHQVERTFQPAVNTRLHGASYRQTHAKSHVRCVRDCHADPACLSVNYLPLPQVCHLNNISRKEHSGSLDVSYDSVYFDADVLTPALSFLMRYNSCQQILLAGHGALSGIYRIFPTGFAEGLQVYCDMETDGGGWIVMQRRVDGSVDFYRNWTDYQVGFGSLSGEFWIGNDILRDLTAVGIWQLRVDMIDWDDIEVYAQYGQFGVSGQDYVLTVGSYNESSTAGDAMITNHDGKKFSTKDNDNDNDPPDSCAVKSHGAWWYDWCYMSNLNGKYFARRVTEFDGLKWMAWKRPQTLKRASMRIRPSL